MVTLELKSTLQKKKSQCFSNKHHLEIQVLLNQVRPISEPTEAHKHKQVHFLNEQ